MDLTQIGTDVYACIQPDTGFGAANSGFVNRGGGLVVDTMYDLATTQRVIDLYATVTREPARRLVNSHHNGDHCWGNQLYAALGSEIIGHRLCAEWFGKDASPEMFVALAEAETVPPGFEQLAADLRLYDFHGIEMTPPTTLIDDDTIVDLDGLAAHLLYVGPAHTPGDVVVHLPSEGVLYTGDILFHRCTPIGWEGTFANWIAALERLEALEPAVVVPGHGPVTDTEGLRDLREYLVFVLAEARSAFDAGLSTLDAARRIELGEYGLWTQPERLAFQIDRAYREFNGVAWDERVDVNHVFADAAELRKHYASATS
jgi:cyclase